LSHGAATERGAGGATSMKVWFSAKAMWDWSTNISDKNCLAIDGPAQDKVYARVCSLNNDTAPVVENLLDQIVARIPQ
jgi:hypothetical protein